MNESKYVKKDIWFAWFPVKTDEGFVWLKFVSRTIDERPLVFMGLTEDIYYEKIKE